MLHSETWDVHLFYNYDMCDGLQLPWCPDCAGCRACDLCSTYNHSKNLAVNMATESEILTELGIKTAPRAKLDVHKNPLFISILDGVDTLKTMALNSDIPPVYLQNAKGLLIMKTDKVLRWFLHLFAHGCLEVV
jgi:hypothetical protein